MAKNKRSIAVFGGGCFWCTEAVFKSLKGVLSVLPGYSGGAIKFPTYEQVRTGATGHAEVVKIEYDQSVISYEDLLTVFFNTHDPTTLNRQGNDVGSQYRSVIFYNGEKERKIAENFIKTLQKEKVYDEPIVTSLEPFEEFYEAEDYHRDFYANNKESMYCNIVIAPKLEKLQRRFAELLNNADTPVNSKNSNT